MPHWTIRTRDDNGKDEKIKVRASDAGEAIRIAEVDISHVLVVKTDWGSLGESGDGSARWKPKNCIVRRLAKLAIAVFLITLALSASETSFDEASIVLTIVVYALVIGAIIVGAVLYDKGKAGFENEVADAAQVLSRDELNDQWWETSLVQWGLLLVGIAIGVKMVVNMPEIEFKIPIELIIPLAILLSVMCDPSDVE